MNPLLDVEIIQKPIPSLITFESTNGTYADVVLGDEIRVTNERLTTDSIYKGNVRVYVLVNSSTEI